MIFDALGNIEPIQFIWVGLAVLAALPGVLFMTWTSVPRLRALSMVAATVGTLLGYAVVFFVWAAVLNGTRLEGAVAFAVAFFIASVTGFCGPLLVNFLAGGGNRARSTQVEF